MSDLAILLSTLTGCFIGSFVPLVNTELLVLSAAAIAPRHLLVPLILIASMTTMTAKSLLYLAGAGLLRLPHERWSATVDAALAVVQARQKAGNALLFASATAGVPPLYLTSIASGALQIDYRRFLLIGLVGRTLRFTVVVLAPQLVKAALS